MAMYFKSEEEIRSLALGVLDHSHPKSRWSHSAHFATLFWLLRNRQDLYLDDDLPGILRTYNVSSGGKNTNYEGYHATITQASLYSGRAFLKTFRNDYPLQSIIERLMVTPLGKPEWLYLYWSQKCLSSVEARQRWIMPDLAPLPILPSEFNKLFGTAF